MASDILKSVSIYKGMVRGRETARAPDDNSNGSLSKMRMSFEETAAHDSKGVCSVDLKYNCLEEILNSNRSKERV